MITYLKLICSILGVSIKLFVAGNKLLVARNMLLQATCYAATSCADEQLVAGNKQHVAGNKLLIARNLLPRNMLRWCKRNFRLLES